MAVTISGSGVVTGLDSANSTDLGAALDAAGGLVMVSPATVQRTGTGTVTLTDGAVSFTDVTSVSLNDVFTSDYENYALIMNATTSATADGLIRFRTSGTNNTTAVYNSRLYTGVGFGAGDTTAGYVWTSQASGYSDLVMHINKPQLALYTQTNYVSNRALVAVVHQNVAGTMGFLGTAQFDGFTLYPASGTFSGTIRVYGYRNGI